MDHLRRYQGGMVQRPGRQYLERFTTYVKAGLHLLALFQYRLDQFFATLALDVSHTALLISSWLFGSKLSSTNTVLPCCSIETTPSSVIQWVGMGCSRVWSALTALSVFASCPLLVSAVSFAPFSSFPWFTSFAFICSASAK